MNSQSPINHIAFVPDGNRRWARAHGIGSEKQVYEQGSDKTFELIKASFESNIPCVTFWGSSYANLMARPKPLVGAIEAIYAKKFREMATHHLIHEYEVNIQVFGEWRDVLKPKTIAAIQQAIDATAHYTKRRLNVLVGYDGVRERGAAALAMIHNASSIQNTTELPQAAQLLRSYAWTGHLPDVDLIVRTGAWQDPHNSAGFLSLITAESQFAFPQVLWPDFTADMLKNIIVDFANRERRLGK